MTVEAADNVLSTLGRDGSRRWLYPRLSKGRLLTARRVVAYFLMGLFLVLPFARINNKPAVLLDIGSRHFTLFGYTFLPTDTILLAILALFVFVSIFLFTAVMGRIWCGWACPQTVYMEFLYRPLERLFHGTVGKGGPGAKVAPWRKVGFFFAALLVTAIPAHTFLAYFVGLGELWRWMRQSPLEHPTAFIIMAVVTAGMFFDFYWFREQLCLIACPYGRFQSALLDKWSLIVSYDRTRGEPRGQKKVSLPVVDGAVAVGDCVDCKLCVTTCPTGIDIREGLQMECINCTQCIDACDAVMTKLSRPKGLIKYSSQAAIAGEKPARFRFRLVLYPVIMTILATAWVLVFVNKGSADVTLLHNFGNPFVTLPSGHIANSLRVKITNRADGAAEYTVSVAGLHDAHLQADENPIHLGAGESKTVGVLVDVPTDVFKAGGAEAVLHITDGKDFSRDVPLHLLGPVTHEAVKDDESRRSEEKK